MAFKIQFRNEQGFICPKEESYCKIINLSGDKNSMTAELRLFHVSSDGIFFPCQLKLTSFTPDLSSDKNFIAQAYLAFKTTEEFALAEDC